MAPYAQYQTGNGKYPSRPNHPDDGKPNTGAQIIVDLYDGTMPRSMPTTTFTYDKARRMVKHPTVFIGRRFAAAPIVSAKYGVEADTDAIREYIEEQVLPHLTYFLYTSLYGEIDFGWSAFEVVYTADGQLDTLKALLNDFTYARRDAETGDFVGLKTTDRYTGQLIYLDPMHSLFVSHDDAGLGAYGTPRLASVELAYDAWLDANDTAQRYDSKMAGGITKIDYMPRVLTDKDGNDSEAFDIAKAAADSMKASGVMIVPNEPQVLGDKAVKTFEVERIDASGGQVDMIARMKYLDACMLRGLTQPERALTEASLSGSRADSVAHADIALLCMSLQANQLLECLNHYLVDRLTQIRFGKTGVAKLVVSALDDESTAQRWKMLLAGITDAATGPDLIAQIDWESELDRLGVARNENPEPVPQPEPTQPPQPQAK
jgi:hypothetical protein